MPFDPNQHLLSQGWQGKGTALKDGHATRPIAVVQKKTLAGVGKDRDESTPFWDHIFASTAMQIKIPSATPTATPSGATTPTAKSSKSPPPATGATQTNYTPATAYARTKKELARVSLYAKFLPGKVITQDDLDVDDTAKSTGPSTRVPKHSVMRRLAAASSTLCGAPEDILEVKLKEARKAQLKEEKAARKTAKLEKAQEKVARRSAREVKRAERAAKKEKKRQRETARLSTSGKEDDDSQSSEEEERKVSIVTEEPDNAISAPEKPPRKKKRKAGSTVEQSITVVSPSDVVAANKSKKRKQDKME